MSFRNHATYHERTLDQQKLDALLRIEEQLVALNNALSGPRATVEATATDVLATQPNGVTRVSKKAVK